MPFKLFLENGLAMTITSMQRKKTIHYPNILTKLSLNGMTMMRIPYERFVHELLRNGGEMMYSEEQGF